MWTTEKILDVLDEHHKQLRDLGAVRLGLFGSYARNSPNPQSDIDFLVVLEQNTFERYMDILFYLEDLFRCKVDLVLEDTLRDELRPYIMSEIVYAPNLQPLS